jgi:hypothetical protein
LQYSVEWHDDAPNAALEERMTVADLAVWLGEQNVTLHLQNETLADHLTISLYGLAEALAHSWWVIFGGRDRPFSWIDHCSGYIVPDLCMAFDGAAFEISARQRVLTNPSIRFWAGPTETMTRSAAEDLLGGFIDRVVGRLREGGLPATSAALRWARVQASRADLSETAFCEAAGALGLDPYQISDEGTALIEDAGALFSGEALPEFLAGAVSGNRPQLIRWVQGVERRPPSMAKIGGLRPAAAEAALRAPEHLPDPSWALGYRRARALRHVLGLGTGDRFRTFRALAEKLGASQSYRLAERIDGLRAIRSDHADGIYIHMRSHGTSAEAHSQHLFSFARAVGDAVCFPAESRAPINELRNAVRQAAGRAFAAEFLAPISEIRSMRADGRDTATIASEFGVSTAVIDRQWENRDRIEIVCSS